MLEFEQSCWWQRALRASHLCVVLSSLLLANMPNRSSHLTKYATNLPSNRECFHLMVEWPTIVHSLQMHQFWFPNLAGVSFSIGRRYWPPAAPRRLLCSPRGLPCEHMGIELMRYGHVTRAGRDLPVLHYPVYGDSSVYYLSPDIAH
jgi:hypothetical protein